MARPSVVAETTSPSPAGASPPTAECAVSELETGTECGGGGSNWIWRPREARPEAEQGVEDELLFQVAS